MHLGANSSGSVELLNGAVTGEPRLQPDDDLSVNLGTDSRRFKTAYYQRSYAGQYTGEDTPSILNDGVYEYTPPGAIGCLMINGRNDAYDYINGLLSYRCTNSGGTYCTAIATINSNMDYRDTTGVPPYTLGIDGKVNVVASDNNKIYFINRLGFAVSIHIVAFGA